MLISDSNRFLFIHIGKTGGMSMRSALQPFAVEPEKFVIRRPARMVGDRPNPLYTVWETLLLHVKARDAKRELPHGVFDSLFKFAFVRNPWDLQVSMYHFILREPKAPRHGEVKALGGFEAFIDWVAATPDPFPKGITKLQGDMITSSDGKMLMDFIGTYENLERDFAYIGQKIGIDAVLPRVNQSRHNDYRTYYNARTRELVAHHFKQDIELFGYTFDGYAGGSLKEMHR